ncbi:hypothetical protein NKG94_50250 [Micromonospora sp. M12]
MAGPPARSPRSANAWTRPVPCRALPAERAFHTRMMADAARLLGVEADRVPHRPAPSRSSAASTARCSTPARRVPRATGRHSCAARCATTTPC